MDRRTRALRLMRGFAQARGGNFAMMGALLLPLLIGAAGVGLDVTRLVLAKTELQDAVDIAALAASSGLANEVMTRTRQRPPPATISPSPCPMPSARA